MQELASELSGEEVRRLLEGAAERTVLVLGDAMLDHYVTGRVERISPEAPVPVVRVEGERRALGGAANVAAGVVALGARCRLVGLVGDDAAADSLAELLRAAGIEDALVRVPGRATTVKSRILARHHQMLRVDREDAGPPEAGARAEVLERARGALEGADVLVLEDYDKGAVWPELARPLLAEARERGVPTVVDPKLRHFFQYGPCEVFKPNGPELAAALGSERLDRSPGALREVRERLGCEQLLVTLGEEGMLLLGPEGEPRRLPSRAREVFDVSGAGDTVTAVLAATCGAGAPVAETARLANFAAGLEVSRLGAVPVSRRELLEAAGSTAPASRGSASE